MPEVITRQNDSAPISMLSRHGRLMFLIAREPTLTKWEIAERCGVTERFVASAIDDFESEGLLVRVRIGRRNNYVIDIVAIEDQLRTEISAFIDKKVADSIASQISTSFSASQPLP